MPGSNINESLVKMKSVSEALPIPAGRWLNVCTAVKVLYSTRTVPNVPEFGCLSIVTCTSVEKELNSFTFDEDSLDLLKMSDYPHF